MDLMALSKLLFVIIVTLPDGSYDTNATEVTECPPYEIVHQLMNYKLETKEITSWYADCNEYPFFEVKKQQI
tara:strand:- start:759 stop:974 length:216 start_codon:yes stop_codon:yes gene_type:complete